MTVRTRLILDGNDLHVNRVQDVEPTLDYAHDQRQWGGKGEEFRPKWTIPPVIQEQLYNLYTQGEMKPMDTEFWKWVDKKIMTDPDYAKFRLGGGPNTFFVGYKK